MKSLVLGLTLSRLQQYLLGSVEYLELVQHLERFNLLNGTRGHGNKEYTD